MEMKKFLIWYFVFIFCVALFLGLLYASNKKSMASKRNSQTIILDKASKESSSSPCEPSDG